ncbi:hypothetical protein ACFY2M_24790 [Streptomyces sp. NPDC001276]|uniref:WXG100-like domain-containing protein n=1 Tax=Streptomyces sp. NPDC001276 TaxID=3364555 RepID=UPI0036765D9F
MAILVPKWLNDLFYALMGERLPQANEDLAYMSHEAFKRFANKLRQLGVLLNDSIRYAAKVLPQKNADAYKRDVRALTDDGGKNHVTEFADQLDDIADGRVKTSINIAESKISLLIELVILAAELLYLAVVAFFSGGATAGEAAEAKLRTRAKILVILDVFAKRFHVLPTLSEALEEAFTTIAARLALILSAAPGRKPHGIDIKDVVLSGVTGGLTSIFDHLFHGGKNLFKGIFKGKTDVDTGFGKKFADKDNMPGLNSLPGSGAVTHGVKSPVSDGPLANGGKIAAKTGDRGFDALGEGVAETFAEGAVYQQGLSFSTFHGAVVSSLNTGLIFEGIQKAGLGFRDFVVPQNLNVAPNPVSAGATTNPAKTSGGGSAVHGAGEDVQVPTSGTGLPAQVSYTPDNLGETGPAPVVTTSQTGTPDPPPVSVHAASAGPGPATVSGGASASTKPAAPGVEQGSTAPETPADHETNTQPPAELDAGTQPTPGHDATHLPNNSQTGPVAGPGKAATSGVNDDSVTHGSPDAHDVSARQSDTESVTGPVTTSGVGPTVPAGNGQTQTSPTHAGSATGPAADTNTPATVKTDGDVPVHSASGSTTGQDRPRADADRNTQSESADAVPTLPDTTHLATTADTATPHGQDTTAGAADVPGDPRTNDIAQPGITPITTVSASSPSRPAGVPDSRGGYGTRADDASNTPQEHGSDDVSATNLVVSGTSGRNDGKNANRTESAAEPDPQSADPMSTVSNDAGTRDEDLAAPAPMSTVSQADDAADPDRVTTQDDAPALATADHIPAPSTADQDTDLTVDDFASDDDDTVADSESVSGDTLVDLEDDTKPENGAEKAAKAGRLPRSQEEISRWIAGLPIAGGDTDDPALLKGQAHPLDVPAQDVTVAMFTGAQRHQESPEGDVIDEWMTLLGAGGLVRRSSALNAIDQALATWNSGSRTTPRRFDDNQREINAILLAISRWRVSEAGENRETRNAVDRLESRLGAELRDLRQRREAMRGQLELRRRYNQISPHLQDWAERKATGHDIDPGRLKPHALFTAERNRQGGLTEQAVRIGDEMAQGDFDSALRAKIKSGVLVHQLSDEQVLALVKKNTSTSDWRASYPELQSYFERPDKRTRIDQGSSQDRWIKEEAIVGDALVTLHYDPSGVGHEQRRKQVLDSVQRLARHGVPVSGLEYYFPKYGRDIRIGARGEIRVSPVGSIAQFFAPNKIIVSPHNTLGLTGDTGHVDGTVEGVLDHEGGHAAHRAWNGSVFHDLTATTFIGDGAGIAHGVSEYASQDPREFVAEVFTGLLRGRSYSRQVLDMYKALGGRELFSTGYDGHIFAAPEGAALRIRGSRRSRATARTPNQLTSDSWLQVSEAIGALNGEKQQLDEAKQRLTIAVDPQTLQEINAPLFHLLGGAAKEMLGSAGENLTRKEALELAGRRDPQTRPYWEWQDERDRRLGRSARVELMRYKTRNTPHAARRTFVETAIRKRAGNPVHVLRDLLRESQGVAVGVVHHGAPIWSTLADNMRDLKSAGVQTLYSESIRGDAYQGDVDAYLESGVMSSELRRFAERYDANMGISGRGLLRLLNEARRHGVRVRGIDGRPARISGQGDEATFHRAVAMNTYASHVIGLDRQRSTSPGRYIVEVGSAHLGLHAGLDRDVMIYGTRIERGEQFPGIDDLLNIPAVIQDNATSDFRLEPANSVATGPSEGVRSSVYLFRSDDAWKSTTDRVLGDALLNAVVNGDIGKPYVAGLLKALDATRLSASTEAAIGMNLSPGYGGGVPNVFRSGPASSGHQHSHSDRSERKDSLWVTRMETEAGEHVRRAAWDGLSRADRVELSRLVAAQTGRDSDEDLARRVEEAYRELPDSWYSQPLRRRAELVGNKIATGRFFHGIAGSEPERHGEVPERAGESSTSRSFDDLSRGPVDPFGGTTVPPTSSAGWGQAVAPDESVAGGSDAGSIPSGGRADAGGEATADGFGGDWGGWKPPADGEAIGGISRRNSERLRRLSDKLNLVIVTRSVNEHGTQRLEEGARPKPLEIKAKSLNLYDRILSEQFSEESLGLVAFFDPKLPANMSVYSEEEQEKIRQRYETRRNEFQTYSGEMQRLKNRFPVIGGIVHEEIGEGEKRPVTADIDLYDLFTPLGGSHLSPRTYQNAVDQIIAEVSPVMHGAAVYWEPDKREDKKVYRSIVEPVEKGIEGVTTFFPGRRPVFGGNFSRKNSLAPIPDEGNPSEYTVQLTGYFQPVTFAAPDFHGNPYKMSSEGDHDRPARGNAVRRAVAAREPRVLDRPGLERAVRSVLAPRDAAVGRSDGPQRVEPPSVSAQDLSVQECLVLLQSLRDELFPQGVAPAGTVDDSVLDGRPQRSSLAVGRGWERVDGWRAVETGLRTAGAGSAALILARRPGRIGHAFAAYSLAADHGTGETEVVWLDLQKPGAAVVSDTVPDISPADAQAIIIDRSARAVANALPGHVDSASVPHAVVDPSRSRQYGALGMEVEFTNILSAAPGSDVRYGAVVAVHVSDSELQLDKQTFWRGGAKLFLDIDDARNAGYLSPTPETHYILEFISDPAAILTGEQRRLNEESVLGLADLLKSRLNVRDGVRLGDVLKDSDGWVVYDGHENTLVYPSPVGADRDSLYTQFTVGMPVGGILPLLHLVEAHDGTTDSVLFAASRRFGMRLTQRFLAHNLGRSFGSGEAYLMSSDPYVSEIWGYGWLLFNHVAAAPVKQRMDLGLTKNRVPVASRNPLGEIRAALRPEVRSFLAQDLGNIRNDFISVLSEVFDELTPNNAPHRLDASIFGAPLALRGFNVGDYLTYAAVGRTSDGRAVGQRIGIAMREHRNYARLEINDGVPLALLELRQYGVLGGLMSSRQMRDYFREVSGLAQNSFENSRLSTATINDVGARASHVFSHPLVRDIGPLLGAIPQLSFGVQENTSSLPSTRSGQIIFLAQSLASVAVNGGVLPQRAREELQSLSDAVQTELATRNPRPAFRSQNFRQQLVQAIRAVQSLTATSGPVSSLSVASQRGASRRPLPAAPRRLPNPPGGQGLGRPIRGEQVLSGGSGVADAPASGPLEGFATYLILDRDGNRIGRGSFSEPEWVVRQAPLSGMSAVDSYRNGAEADRHILTDPDDAGRLVPWKRDNPGSVPYFFAAHGFVGEVELASPGGSSVRVSGSALGRVIRRRPSFESGRPIVLASCWGGTSSAAQLSVAQQVADVTGSTVYGATSATTSSFSVAHDAAWVAFHPQGERDGRLVQSAEGDGDSGPHEATPRDSGSGAEPEIARPLSAGHLDVLRPAAQSAAPAPPGQGAEIDTDKDFVDSGPSPEQPTEQESTVPVTPRTPTGQPSYGTVEVDHAELDKKFGPAVEVRKVKDGEYDATDELRLNPPDELDLGLTEHSAGLDPEIVVGEITTPYDAWNAFAAERPADAGHLLSEVTSRMPAGREATVDDIRRVYGRLPAEYRTQPLTTQAVRIVNLLLTGLPRTGMLRGGGRLNLPISSGSGNAQAHPATTDVSLTAPDSSESDEIVVTVDDGSQDAPQDAQTVNSPQRPTSARMPGPETQQPSSAPLARARVERPVPRPGVDASGIRRAVAALLPRADGALLDRTFGDEDLPTLFTQALEGTTRDVGRQKVTIRVVNLSTAHTEEIRQEGRTDVHQDASTTVGAETGRSRRPIDPTKLLKVPTPYVTVSATIDGLTNPTASTTKTGAEDTTLTETTEAVGAVRVASHTVDYEISVTKPNKDGKTSRVVQVVQSLTWPHRNAAGVATGRENSRELAYPKVSSRASSIERASRYRESERAVSGIAAAWLSGLGDVRSALLPRDVEYQAGEERRIEEWLGRLAAPTGELAKSLFGGRPVRETFRTTRHGEVEFILAIGPRQASAPGGDNPRLTTSFVDRADRTVTHRHTHSGSHRRTGSASHQRGGSLTVSTADLLASLIGPSIGVTVSYHDKTDGGWEHGQLFRQEISETEAGSFAEHEVELSYVLSAEALALEANIQGTATLWLTSPPSSDDSGAGQPPPENLDVPTAPDQVHARYSLPDIAVEDIAGSVLTKLGAAVDNPAEVGQRLRQFLRDNTRRILDGSDEVRFEPGDGVPHVFLRGSLDRDRGEYLGEVRNRRLGEELVRGDDFTATRGRTRNAAIQIDVSAEAGPLEIASETKFGTTAGERNRVRTAAEGRTGWRSDRPLRLRYPFSVDLAIGERWPGTWQSLDLEDPSVPSALTAPRTAYIVVPAPHGTRVGVLSPAGRTETEWTQEDQRASVEEEQALTLPPNAEIDTLKPVSMLRLTAARMLDDTPAADRWDEAVGQVVKRMVFGAAPTSLGTDESGQVGPVALAEWAGAPARAARFPLATGPTADVLRLEHHNERRLLEVVGTRDLVGEVRLRTLLTQPRVLRYDAEHEFTRTTSATAEMSRNSERYRQAETKIDAGLPQELVEHGALVLAATTEAGVRHGIESERSDTLESTVTERYSAPAYLVAYHAEHRLSTVARDHKSDMLGRVHRGRSRTRVMTKHVPDAVHVWVEADELRLHLQQHAPDELSRLTADHGTTTDTVIAPPRDPGRGFGTIVLHSFDASTQLIQGVRQQLGEVNDRKGVSEQAAGRLRELAETIVDDDLAAHGASGGFASMVSQAVNGGVPLLRVHTGEESGERELLVVLKASLEDGRYLDSLRDYAATASTVTTRGTRAGTGTRVEGAFSLGARAKADNLGEAVAEGLAAQALTTAASAATDAVKPTVTGSFTREAGTVRRTSGQETVIVRRAGEAHRFVHTLNAWIEVQTWSRDGRRQRLATHVLRSPSGEVKDTWIAQDPFRIPDAVRLTVMADEYVAAQGALPVLSEHRGSLRESWKEGNISELPHDALLLVPRLDAREIQRSLDELINGNGGQGIPMLSAHRAGDLRLRASSDQLSRHFAETLRADGYRIDLDGSTLQAVTLHNDLNHLRLVKIVNGATVTRLREEASNVDEVARRNTGAAVGLTEDPRWKTESEHLSKHTREAEPGTPAAATLSQGDRFYLVSASMRTTITPEFRLTSHDTAMDSSAHGTRSGKDLWNQPQRTRTATSVWMVADGSALSALGLDAPDDRAVTPAPGTDPQDSSQISAERTATEPGASGTRRQASDYRHAHAEADALTGRVRRGVAPRVSRILDRPGLEHAVRKAVAAREADVTRSADPRRVEPASLSAQEMSVQECLALLQSLRNELFPQGVAPAGTADDSVLNVDPQRSSLAVGPGWNRIAGLAALETALRNAGVGSTAFVLARHPHRIGHAFAAYALRPERDGDETAVVWIDLQRSGAHRISDVAPDLSPVETQAIVIDHTARVVADAFSGDNGSTWAATLVDSAVNHQYGAIGMEVEFEQYLDLRGDLQHEVIATHASGSEIHVDRAPVWRAGGEAFVERFDALKAGHLNPVLEMRNLLEFVSSPAAILDRESRTLNLNSILRLVSDTQKRLPATGRRRLREIFGPRDGWTINPEFADTYILAAPQGNRRESPYAQFTVGVPVDGILPMLQLVEARFGRSRDVLERLFIASRNFGALLAQRYIESRSGQALAPGEVDLFTNDSRVREVWGYGWLLFNHVSAVPVHNLLGVRGIVKNLIPVASRNPLGAILEDLTPEVRIFLAGELERIKQDVVNLLRHHLGTWDPGRMQSHSSAIILDQVLLDGYHTVDDYITYAVRGSVRRENAVSQRVGVGMNVTTPYEYLDSHGDVSLALLELRNYGYDKGRMTAAYLDYYFREVSTVSRNSFAYHRRKLDESLGRAVQKLLSHAQVRQIAPLLEAARYIRPNGESEAYRQSVIDGSQNQRLVRYLGDLALHGRPLPTEVARELTDLANGARRELVATDSPEIFRSEDIRQRLHGAIRAVRSLTAPAAPASSSSTAPAPHHVTSRRPLPSLPPRPLPSLPGGQGPGNPRGGERTLSGGSGVADASASGPFEGFATYLILDGDGNRIGRGSFPEPERGAWQTSLSGMSAVDSYRNGVESGGHIFTDPNGEERPVPWRRDYPGSAPYFFASHGFVGEVELASSGGSSVRVSGSTLGHVIRRRPSFETGRPIVLAACRGGTASATQPSVAQQVADVTGSTVYGATSVTTSTFSVAGDASWLAFQPQAERGLRISQAEVSEGWHSASDSDGSAESNSSVAASDFSVSEPILVGGSQPSSRRRWAWAPGHGGGAPQDGMMPDLEGAGQSIATLNMQLVNVNFDGDRLFNAYIVASDLRDESGRPMTAARLRRDLADRLGHLVREPAALWQELGLRSLEERRALIGAVAAPGLWGNGNGDHFPYLLASMYGVTLEVFPFHQGRNPEDWLAYEHGAKTVSLVRFYPGTPYEHWAAAVPRGVTPGDSLFGGHSRDVTPGDSLFGGHSRDVTPGDSLFGGHSRQATPASSSGLALPQPSGSVQLPHERFAPPAPPAALPNLRERSVMDVDAQIYPPTREAVYNLGNEAWASWHSRPVPENFPFQRDSAHSPYLQPRQMDELFELLKRRSNGNDTIGGVWDHIHATYGIYLARAELLRLNDAYKWHIDRAESVESGPNYASIEDMFRESSREQREALMVQAVREFKGRRRFVNGITNDTTKNLADGTVLPSVLGKWVDNVRQGTQKITLNTKRELLELGAIEPRHARVQTYELVGAESSRAPEAAADSSREQDRVPLTAEERERLMLDAVREHIAENGLARLTISKKNSLNDGTKLPAQLKNWIAGVRNGTLISTATKMELVRLRVIDARDPRVRTFAEKQGPSATQR